MYIKKCKRYEKCDLMRNAILHAIICFPYTIAWFFSNWSFKSFLFISDYLRYVKYTCIRTNNKGDW